MGPKYMSWRSLVPLFFLIALAITYQYWPKDPLQKNSELIEGATSAYSVQLSVYDRTQAGTKSYLDLTGRFLIERDEKQNWTSEWDEVDSLSFLGKTYNKSDRTKLSHKPIMSIYSTETEVFKHVVGADFPEEFIAIQQNFQFRIFPALSVKNLESGSFEKREKDEMGSYRVLYSVNKTTDSIKITRTWLEYFTPGIKIDSADHSIRYEYSKNGTLHSVSGRITLHQRLAEAHHVTTEIQLALAEDQDSRLALARPSEPTRTLVTKPSSNSKPKGTESERIANTDEATRILTQLEELSNSVTEAQVYELFTKLKTTLNNDPSLSELVGNRILSLQARDRESKRSLRAMFGALAQSESSVAADRLARLISECPDDFCQMQAVVGISDHPSPSEFSVVTLEELAESSPSEKIASTALLSVASLSRQHNLRRPEFNAKLIESLKDPEKATRKTAIVAAMGNQGLADYYPALKEIALHSEDRSLQATAAYSLRFLPQKAADQTILDVLRTSPTKLVMNEAMKALDYRSLTPAQYRQFARNAGQLKDPDLAATAAQILLHAYENDPTLIDALQLMREATKFEGIKQQLNPQIPTP